MSVLSSPAFLTPSRLTTVSATTTPTATTRLGNPGTRAAKYPSKPSATAPAADSLLIRNSQPAANPAQGLSSA